MRMSVIVVMAVMVIVTMVVIVPVAFDGHVVDLEVDRKSVV